MRKYVLCRHTISDVGQVEITEKQYRALEGALATLCEISEAEEKFHALMDNYFELERGLLEEALRATVYSDVPHYQDAKLIISRRTINVLTAVKLYLDSFCHHASALLSGEPLEELKKEPSRAYDRSLSYKAGEALRNYAQHEALPVHNWNVHFDRDMSVKPNLFVSKVDPELDLEILQRSDFKKSVLQKLKDQHGTTAAIKPLLREYLEQLGLVHEKFRSATAAVQKEAMELIDSAVRKFVSEFPGSKVSLVAVPLNEDGIQDGEQVYLSATVIESLPRLQREFRTFANFSLRRVVS